METIILASGSRQRQEYFRLLGLPFRVIPPALDESLETNVPGRLAAERLAKAKAQSVNKRLAENEKTWILGADTLISLDGRLLGKARDQDQGRDMLRALQGKTHEVITAMALLNERKNVCDCCSVVSYVSFAAMDDAEIGFYLDTGEWKEAAGAYRIQGKASCFIEKISGSYSSVVGLPLREFYVMLQNNGYPLLRITSS